MNLGHESVEMHAALGVHGDRREEQIHQRRLAAADQPVKIEPARRRAPAAGERGPDPRGEAARRRLRQAQRQRLQPLERGELRGIALERAAGDERVIAGEEGAGRFHARLASGPSALCRVTFTVGASGHWPLRRRRRAIRNRAGARDRPGPAS